LYFISTSTIHSTYDAIIHLAVMGKTLTNQVHPKVWQFELLASAFLIKVQEARNG
jgi:hypothetical protein